MRPDSRAGSEAAPLIKAPSNGKWSPKPALLAIGAVVLVALGASVGGSATSLRGQLASKEKSAKTTVLALSSKGDLPDCNPRIPVKESGDKKFWVTGNCVEVLSGRKTESCAFYDWDPCKEWRCGTNKWRLCRIMGAPNDPDLGYEVCISYDVPGYHFEAMRQYRDEWNVCVRDGASLAHSATWDWDDASRAPCVEIATRVRVDGAIGATASPDYGGANACQTC